MPLVDDPDKGRGLYQKFIVRRADPAAQAKHRHCSHFVLDMTHDRLALSAIKAYAAEARVHGYEALAYDLYDLYVPATSPIPAPASEPVASERSVTPSPAAGEGERTAMSASERSLFAMLHQVYAECLTPIAAAFGFDGPELDESFVEYMHERAGELARLREKSAALTRREASETMGARAWRPIETAPKDETWVILFTPDGVQCGYWGATYFGMNPAWVQYAHRSECEEVNGEPTHWMPLPEPPSNGREASEGELEGDALQRLWDHADAQPSDYAAFVLGWRNALAWVRKDQNRAPRMADIRREASEGERLRREACEALGAQIDAWTRVASNGLHDRELYRLYEQACAQAGRTYDEAVTAAIAAARAKEEK